MNIKYSIIDSSFSESEKICKQLQSPNALSGSSLCIYIGFKLKVDKTKQWNINEATSNYTCHWSVNMGCWVKM